MKYPFIALLSLLVCALLLTACAEKVPHKEVPPTPNIPTQEETVPSTGETASPDTHTLSQEALDEYTSWFAQKEFNGLLRFPYDNGADWEQIVPYLDFLFYDIGETDLSPEELTALEAAGMFMELDEFRLSRTFVVDYLVTWLDMPPDDAETMLHDTEDPFGVYLPETDAWYMCHGDTAWMPYTFEYGVSLSDAATVTLYYTNPFLTVVLEDGEVEFLTEQPMAVTISIEGGERKVLSNKILSSPYN